MSNTHAMPTELLKFKGIFDMEHLYRTLRGWFTRRGYYLEEPTYKSKPTAMGGTEDEIELKGYRKETDYFKFWVSVYIHTWDCKEVEVIKDGKKKKMNQARMTIKFGGYIESDYQNRWQSTPFLKWLNNMYENYIINPEISNVYEDKLYYYILKLYDLAKECLGSETKGSEYTDMW